MIGRCSVCKTTVGGLDNYGNNENPLCYDCANGLKCSACGQAIDIHNQIKIEDKLFCIECKEQLEAKRNGFEIIKNDGAENADSKQAKGRSFFALEKKVMRMGVKGGMIMIVIAIVWFVGGYAAGYIYYYPLILLLIGIYTLVKGFVTGDVPVQKSAQTTLNNNENETEKKRESI